MQTRRFLVIQTAFIGDAILATSLLEKLHRHFPESSIDFMIRKGNEGLFLNHPFIKNLIVWNKNEAKYTSLLAILKQVRLEPYDYVINLQRFAATGLFTAFSKAKCKVGFAKNPFSFLFNQKIEHSVNDGNHEIERNQKLIEKITDNEYLRPKIYPSRSDFEKVKEYTKAEFITISPASVWFTKQFPTVKWIEFINKLPSGFTVYLLGGPGDLSICNQIKDQCNSANIKILAGKLNLLQSAALMLEAKMNFTNDSAPLHLASATNSRITAVFCSTSPNFGFGPLSDNSKIVQSRLELLCKPCGLHGKKACPQKHFNCAMTIDTNDLMKF